jgi:hypothetical protein
MMIDKKTFNRLETEADLQQALSGGNTPPDADSRNASTRTFLALMIFAGMTIYAWKCHPSVTDAMKTPKAATNLVPGK